MTAPATYRRPLPVIAVIGPALAVIAAIALALAGPGSQWGWWHFSTGFSILRWSAYLGVAAAVLSLLGAIATRPGTGRRGFIAGLFGVIVGLAVAVIPWTVQRTARAAPPIHDITTDTEDPPAFVAILERRAGARNPAEYGGPEIAQQQRRAYPEIVPLRLGVPPERAFAAALDAARSLRWEIVAADSAAGRIEATDRTLWFGFLDDVVIRVRPENGGSRVDVRSVSRVGRGDAGANARRIVRFIGELRQRLDAGGR